MMQHSAECVHRVIDTCNCRKGHWDKANKKSKSNLGRAATIPHWLQWNAQNIPYPSTIATRIGVRWGTTVLGTAAISGECYSDTTVYYGIHERSECIPVDSGVTNLTHDRRCCVDFTFEVQANVAWCVHSSVNKPGVKCNSGLWDVYPLQTLLWR